MILATPSWKPLVLTVMVLAGGAAESAPGIAAGAAGAGSFAAWPVARSPRDADIAAAATAAGASSAAAASGVALAAPASAPAAPASGAAPVSAPAAAPVSAPAAAPAAAPAGAASPSAAEGAKASAAPGEFPPPVLRLPAGVRPSRYAVELTLSPESETFTGVIDIDLQVESPTRVLWLNGTKLTIGEVSLSSSGGTTRPTVVPGGEDFVGFVLDAPMAPGRATLHIAYTGNAPTKESEGIFRQKEVDDWYLFTQFEEIDARRAFPCFDEPSYKVPWQLTLRVRKDLVAVSNAPIASETPLPDGLKAVRFAETKPLPSYLVAFAVGPFGIAEGPPLGSRKVPFRVITPKGQQALASFTVTSTPELLALLEKYFGTPYPYDKLDLVAVPVFGGAMENAGMITFGRRLLLIKPEEETPGRQRSFAITTAHELAHMWFGDLVTLKWWDDTWLNESFASWMENKIVEQWRPGWDIAVSRVRDRETAMSSDTLVTARRIRQPIETRNDILNAFDRITYEKGSAVLSMFESWLGAERLQKGVQRYLAAYAWKNADANDFFGSISAEAGKDVTAVLETFVDQGGIPLVTAQIVCSGGAAPTLKLRQARYLPAGSKGSTDQTWKIPVCVRYGSGDESHRQCVVLGAPEMDFPLEAGACPQWLLPNADAAGYYRARVGPAQATGSPSVLARLFEGGGKRLTLPEKVGTLSDLSALATSGEVPRADVLALVPTILADHSRHTVESAIGIVEGLRSHLVPDPLLPNYQRFVRKTFGDRARALGLGGPSSEPEDQQLLRPGVFTLVAEGGEDEGLQQKARALALRWLKDGQGIQADMIDAVLSAAVRHGDEALFDRFHAAARSETDRTRRRRLLNAMASFVDPKIAQKRMPILLTEEFEAREGLVLYWGSLGEPATRDLALAFLEKNYDALVRRLPEGYEASLARAGTSFCDEAHRAEVESFFKDRTSKAPGGPRILSQTLERIDLCIASKRVQQESVAAFLRKQ